MTNARPEKCKCHIPPKYQCPRHGCCNETITAYDAYTDELLKPLEYAYDIYIKAPQEMIGDKVLWDAIKTTIEKYKAWEGEGEA